jgi:hypothetical protein
MVIRRIRGHAMNHNWFAVAVDLAIVVVGVFLGLQANNWNASRLNNAEAREYQAQIISNLRANEADMRDRAAYYSQVRDHAVAALDALQAPKPLLGERFLVDAYLASSTNRRPLERSAYDEMVGSGVGRGTLGLRLREQMSAFYAQIPQFNDNVLSIAPYKETLRRSMLYSVQHRIGETCIDRVETAADGVQTVAMPTDCQVRLDHALVDAAVRGLEASPELEPDLTRQITDLDQKLYLFRRYGRLAHDLRIDLERGMSMAS